MKDVWNTVFTVKVNNTHVRTLPPTMNSVYVFLHLFYHFIREGVALRQFCDWAMVLHNYYELIDKKKLSQILVELDLVNAYRAFGSVLIDELGLPEREFPFDLNNKDRKWRDVILQDVFKGGNFGRDNHKASSVLGYKLETACLMLKNCWKYYPLAPSELRMMIPKMVKVNLRLIANR